MSDGWVVYSLEDAKQVYATRLHELTEDEWARLESALAQVLAADSSGSSRAQRQFVDDSWGVPASSLSTAAAELVGALDELGFHIHYDWFGWEAGKLAVDRPDMLDRLSAAEAAMVVFIIWRMYRHSDGAVLEAFENGIIQRAVRRMLTARAAGAGA